MRRLTPPLHLLLLWLGGGYGGAEATEGYGSFMALLSSPVAKSLIVIIVHFMLSD